jgi:membrane protease YdiL (CAAX protease family)
MPVVEEAFLRGAVFGRLQRTWHLFWAVLLSAAFSVVCLPMQAWLAFVFLAGIGYALAFRLSGSLPASIIAHVIVAGSFLLARMHPAGIAGMPDSRFWQAGGMAVLLIIFGSLAPKRRG